MARRRSKIAAPWDPIGAAGAQWFSAAAQTWLLGLEAAQVIGLRADRIAAGGVPAATESSLMVAEKLAAAMELQARLYAGTLGSTPASIANGTIDHYRRKVRANRRRLRE